MLRLNCQASVPRDVFPPTPPGPEGSNGNGLLRVQWVSGAWLEIRSWLLAFGFGPFSDPELRFSPRRHGEYMKRSSGSLRSQSPHWGSLSP